MTATIEFVDELPSCQDRRRVDPKALQRFASAVRKRPGMWAKLPSALGGDINQASHIRNGTGPVPFRGGDWDAVFRNGQIYVRYTGDGAPSVVRDPNFHGRSVVGDELSSWLRRHPLEWGVWPTRLTPSSARTYLGLIPAGKLKAFPARLFQAKLRGNSELLVRFVGGAQ